MGGGVLGLVAGLRRAEAGDLVTIFEAGEQIGGLAGSFNVGTVGEPVMLEKFYHHIFRTDRDIIRLVAEMGLDSEMVWGTPPTCTLWDGKIYRMDGVFAAGSPFAGTHFDTALALLNFAPLPFLDRVRFAAMGAKLKFTDSHEGFAGQTAAQWARREAGDTAFERVLLPLLRGKFGDRYSEIAQSWLWSRFHERTQQLGYLRGGFDRLYAEVARRFTEAGGVIRTSASVADLRTGAGGVTLTTQDGAAETFDRVLVTAPTNAFLTMAAGELPDDYVVKYRGAVDYLAAHCLVLSFAESFGSFYWLNVNDAGYPFLALVEHTNFLPASDYGGQHLLYVGNYLPQNHPLLSKSATDILSQFAPFLTKINPRFDAERVRGVHSFAATHAQPVVTADYAERLPPHETPLPGVFLANMAHVYPQDRGQNYSIRLGERMANLL
ncbi:MAG: FAD-dependent oxidoreductase [Armatimonadetes bacterium]|nr:FAD-dependent oxidoreductase [Armatimonadota bacterium]